MTIRSISLMAALAIASMLGAAGFAQADTEYPPPSGKGPVVVVVSGQLGAAAYVPEAKQIAGLGYDVVLLDGNSMEGSHGQKLMEAVTNAQSLPHGTAGKVGVVGFSLGGGEALGYASRWPDLVAVVVVFYPATSGFKDLTAFAGSIKVPVLMLAGETDTYKNCCLIDNARTLATAAAAAGTPFELITYPGVGHDFIRPGPNYNTPAATDSWQRATAKLAQYLPH
jgi:dienelactone hydrolase